MDWLPQKSSQIQRVVSAYSSHLGHRFGAPYQKKFEQLNKSNEQAAVAEAVVFTWLYSIGHNCKILEDPSTGGADFMCYPHGLPDLVVEVTSLGQAPLANKTDWSNDLDHQGGQFSLPVKLIQQRVRQKIRQLSKYSMPRVVAIVSSHIGATAFISSETALQFLLGGYKFGFVVSDPDRQQHQWAAFENSVFIRRDKSNPDQIVPAERSVSALLLIALDGAGFSVVGVLHPQPYFPFDCRTFPNVPFLYVSPWPTVEGKIHVDWSTEAYPPTRVDLKPIVLATPVNSSNA